MYVGTFAQGGSAAIVLLYPDREAYLARGPELIASLDDVDLLAEMLNAVQADANVALRNFGMPELLSLAHRGLGLQTCRVETDSGASATVRVSVLAGSSPDDESGDDDEGELGIYSIQIAEC